jgi:glycosyltransferase involved in cell wall biosynthesis
VGAAEEWILCRDFLFQDDRPGSSALTDAPTFSIVMPVFNGGVYLLRAVSSALNQSCSDFELILVDDGSTDHAVNDVVKLHDPRIRVLRQANGGAPSACNLGVKHARGAYVAFLDQDDMWSAEKLARHLETFRRHTDVDLTFTWTAYIGEADQDLGLPVHRWRGRVTFSELLVDNVIGPTSSAAIRRAAIEEAGGFDPRLPLTYDLDLFLRILRLRPANALAIPEVLTFYRRHAFQMSRDWQAFRKDWRALLEKVGSLAPEDTAHLRLKADLNMTRYCAFLAYERRKFDSGCRLLGEGLRMDPLGFLTDVRNWKLTAACLAGWALPPAIHRRLESLAGIRTFSA